MCLLHDGGNSCEISHSFLLFFRINLFSSVSKPPPFRSTLKYFCEIETNNISTFFLAECLLQKLQLSIRVSMSYLLDHCPSYICTAVSCCFLVSYNINIVLYVTITIKKTWNENLDSSPDSIVFDSAIMENFSVGLAPSIGSRQDACLAYLWRIIVADCSWNHLQGNQWFGDVRRPSEIHFLLCCG